MTETQLLQDVEKLDKELRHKPVELWCLGCGRLVSSNFTGGLWSYTDICGSRTFVSKRGPLIPSSLFACPFKFEKCTKCKTEEEHIQREIEKYLGKDYKKAKLTKELREAQDSFIDLVNKKVR